MSIEPKPAKHPLRALHDDERGVVMVEYLIVLATMIVAFIWLNKITDTLLFGSTPYDRVYAGSGAGTEEIPLAGTPQDMRMGREVGYSQEFIQTMIVPIAGSGAEQERRPDRSHLGQINRHLANP